jgi:hypothetical protein
LENAAIRGVHHLAYAMDGETMSIKLKLIALPVGKLSDTQFTYLRGDDGEPDAINLPCRGGKYNRCTIEFVKGAPANGLHGWDGNVEGPTITPSIGCDARCGWHGHLIKGEMKP